MAMKKKDVKEILVLSNEKPWLLVGRPGSQHLLCFKRQEGKRDSERKVKSWKKKVFKRRSTVFGTNLVIGSESEVCFLLLLFVCLFSVGYFVASLFFDTNQTQNIKQ